MRRTSPFLLAACLCLSARAETAATRPTTAPTTQAALGSADNPVRCDHPRGERAYLARLRDAAGKAPRFAREGSFGRGPDGHILDRYEVTSADGTTVAVYMDMYHPDHEETEPIAGFTLVAR